MYPITFIDTSCHSSLINIQLLGVFLFLLKEKVLQVVAAQRGAQVS